MCVVTKKVPGEKELQGHLAQSLKPFSACDLACLFVCFLG